MGNFIKLTKKFSEDEDEIVVNPQMIAYIEIRRFQGKVYTEVGLMGGKSFEVVEDKNKIISLIEKSSLVKNLFRNTNSENE